MPRRHISKIRGRSQLRRRPGQREPRSITLIVCEGETEEAYFEAARVHFNLTTAEVVVADNTQGAAPISVVECAEERAEERGGYDTIFCVFDRDGHQSLDRARSKIKGLASRSRNQLGREGPMVQLSAMLRTSCHRWTVAKQTARRGVASGRAARYRGPAHVPKIAVRAIQSRELARPHDEADQVTWRGPQVWPARIRKLTGPSSLTRAVAR